MAKEYFGVYRGICVDNADPEGLFRIRLTVPQVTSDNVTNWAMPCIPISSHADHPDHLPHLASEVAALLNSHSVSVSGTTGSGGSTPHTHSFSASQSLSHTGTTGELTHAHEDSVDPLEVNGTDHTPHRKVPDLNQGVWVMFEGGDPNFPVWIGVY